MRYTPIISALALVLGTAVGLSPAVAAPADTRCDTPGTGFDTLYCERKVFMQADADLNSSYRKLMALLPRPDRLTLQTGQRAWIRQRDTQCNRSDDSSIRVDIECAKDQTIQRTNWLNDRLRECSSSGCRSSRLSQ